MGRKACLSYHRRKPGKRSWMGFLQAKGLLNPVQGSKTEYYFDTYMGR